MLSVDEALSLPPLVSDDCACSDNGSATVRAVSISPGRVGCYIDNGLHPPIKQQPYRTGTLIVRRAIISEMIDNMRNQGVIRPSVSPWASPIVLVPKKDGTYRFCVYFRHLNAVTKKDMYPLLRIDDILNTLGDSNYFSSLDLASGYWQVELDPKSRQKSAFTTYRGLEISASQLLV